MVLSDATRFARFRLNIYLYLLSMKTHSCSKQQLERYIIALFVAVCGLFTLAGCATMESASQESLLQKAGFQSRTPTTAKQKAAYAKLPAYRLHRGKLKGRTLYAYKDEKAGVVYIGNEAQYQQYKQAAAKAKLKEEQITPAQAAIEEQDMHTYSQWYEGRIP
jgi:hypothetical protein